MDKRFITFAVLVMGLFLANQLIYSFFFPAPPPAKIAAARPKSDKDKTTKAGADDATKAGAQVAKKGPEGPGGDKSQPAGEPVAEAQNNADQDNAAQEKAIHPQWVALGSADPKDPYRLLVIATNRGAAIERIELNHTQYDDLEDRSGYLGYLAPTDAPNGLGAVVQVVGAGTPAAAAGLQVNDVITAVSDHRVTSAVDLIEALKQVHPRESATVKIQREGAAKQLTATLDRQPLAVIRPEFDSQPVELPRPGNHDQLSFLMTILQLDERVIGTDNGELAGVSLREGEWEVAAANQDSVSFRKLLPKLGLQVTKTFRLEKVPPDEMANANFPAYGLSLDVSIANVGDREHRVAYRLDGPTGLPIEGAWYANKVSRTWGAAGLRDVIPRFNGRQPEQFTPAQLADPEFKQNWANAPLDYIAVDAQYFSAAMIPRKDSPDEVLFADIRPLRVGAIPKDKVNYKLIDVSFELDSKVVDLAPGGAPLEHHFQIFTGPKRPDLLAEYGPPGASLKDLLYYGWFGVVSVPMLAILHVFYKLVGNYGVAIIMLTVVVRGFMFPLSRKQAQSAQKMQELQPEMKRLAEKYKTEPEKRTKAQQELFRTHNYNPMGGCLLGFVQLPVFVGLYKSLSVDVELRQAALFGDNIRWASNLAAPDMFWNWSALVPEFVSQGTGFLGLGPYLNIFPLITIALFIVQQKMFMPPPADEQAAIQQKMMQYMMIFMGIMFFKVASGLCLYFIASSLWGIVERKLLPKATPPGTQPRLAGVGGAPTGSASGNGSGSSKNRQRGRKS